MTERTHKRVLVAMSGGVDSSVCVILLQQAGWECVGATMRLHADGPCAQAGETDIADARSVCDKLGIPHHVIDLVDDFEHLVIDDFVGAYENGRTPNPCVTCNRTLKFGALMDEATRLGCDALATGHYAQVVCDEAGTYHLLRGIDAGKDQSYMLHMLGQEQLARVVLPLGSMHKDEVRALAQEASLTVAHKSDSQDICFVADGDWASFVSARADKGNEPGDICLTDGTVVGQHHGLLRYTLGQRRGLDVPWKKPLYVRQIDVANNRLVLDSADSLNVTSFTCSDVSWIDATTQGAIRCHVCINYHAIPRPCTVTIGEGGTVTVAMDDVVRAPTPGQAAVFYRDDECLGGGTID